MWADAPAAAEARTEDLSNNDGLTIAVVVGRGRGGVSIAGLDVMFM